MLCLSVTNFCGREPMKCRENVDTRQASDHVQRGRKRLVGRGGHCRPSCAQDAGEVLFFNQKQCNASSSIFKAVQRARPMNS